MGAIVDGIFDPDATWQWTENKYRAARLIAEGDLPQRGVADACGITARTLQNWLARQEFAGYVSQLVTEMRDACKDIAIANKTQRLIWKNRRHAALREIAAERREKFSLIAETEIDDLHPDAEVKVEAGMASGFMKKKVTIVHGKGGGRVETVEFDPDYQLNTAMSNLENEAGKETGDLVDQKNINFRGSVTDEAFDYSKLSDEELEAFEQLRNKAAVK